MVDTPFVSEEFQRAFRNNFPSQVSSGRDLHVSDVVVPIVDFSPTASGASLALELRNCINNNSIAARVNTATTTTITSETGFQYVRSQLYGDGSSSRAEYQLYDGTTGTTVLFQLAAASSTSDLEGFVVYIKSGDSLRVITDSASDIVYSVTPVADINGNLINPNGYNPQ